MSTNAVTGDEYDSIRRFEVTRKDGSTQVVESLGLPWQFRTWLCVEDHNGRVKYMPIQDVEFWSEA